MLNVYTLANCDSCRRAVKWLRANKIDFEERAIRESPPSVAELRAALRAKAGAVGKLFNTSGKDYRDQKLGQKLPALTEQQALELLAANGNLVKRPFAVGDGFALVGFNEEEWSTALSTRNAAGKS